MLGYDIVNLLPCAIGMHIADGQQAGVLGIAYLVMEAEAPNKRFFRSKTTVHFLERGAD